jgi:very-short-patch-repair endonuclease
VLELPFRGSEAVARGLVTRGELRGPRYRSLFPGIFVRAEVVVDYAMRCRAGVLIAGGRGVLGGWSAAELLGAPCAPAAADVEVVLPGTSLVSRTGLTIRADALLPEEITQAKGVRVTAPVRTAFDLARREPVLDAIIGVDALRRHCGVEPAAVLTVAAAHRNARRSRHLPSVLARSTALADSPMETRIRVAMEDAGLRAPVLQHPVGMYRLDLAYPDLRLAIEYDGREHLTQERARKDLDRQAYLSARHWEIERLLAWEVFLPSRVAMRVGYAIETRLQAIRSTGN